MSNFKGDVKSLSLLPADVINLLAVIRESILKVSEVSAIVLYGSYARGNWNEQSDIDIAVFLGDNEKDIHYFYKEFNKVTSDSKYDVQFQVFDESELLEPAGIVEEVVMFGIDVTLIGQEQFGAEDERCFN